MIPIEKAYEAEICNRFEYTNLDKLQQFFQWLVRFMDDNSILLKIENFSYDNYAYIMLQEVNWMKK